MHHPPQGTLSPGYSAVELLVVVALIALLAAVSFPMFDETFRVARLDGAARELVGEIRHARSLAVSRGGYYGLHTSGNTYRVERVQALGDGPWSSPDVVTQWQDLSYQFRGVSIQSVASGSPIDGPIFSSLGASVGTNGAARSVAITLRNASGAMKIIQVSPTGNVSMP